MKMNEILASNYGANRNGRIRVNFNKLIRTKEYESERVEADFELDLAPGENPELALVKAQASLEYAVYESLLFKHQIEQADFSLRVQELEEAVTQMENKLKGLGIDVTIGN